MHPDNKDAAINQAEFRIQVEVQKDVQERWKTRMENEGKITATAVEALRSEVTKMSTKMAEEVVCMKNRHQQYGIWICIKRRQCGNFTPRLVQNTFVTSRVELKGWSSWRNIRGTGITLDEAKQLVSMAKARLKQD